MRVWRVMKWREKKLCRVAETRDYNPRTVIVGVHELLLESDLDRLAELGRREGGLLRVGLRRSAAAHCVAE